MKIRWILWGTEDHPIPESVIPPKGELARTRDSHASNRPVLTETRDPELGWTRTIFEAFDLLCEPPPANVEYWLGVTTLEHPSLGSLDSLIMDSFEDRDAWKRIVKL